MMQRAEIPNRPCPSVDFKVIKLENNYTLLYKKYMLKQGLYDLS